MKALKQKKMRRQGSDAALTRKPWDLERSCPSSVSTCTLSSVPSAHDIFGSQDEPTGDFEVGTADIAANDTGVYMAAIKRQQLQKDKKFWREEDNAREFRGKLESFFSEAGSSDEEGEDEDVFEYDASSLGSMSNDLDSGAAVSSTCSASSSGSQAGEGGRSHGSGSSSGTTRALKSVEAKMKGLQMSRSMELMKRFPGKVRASVTSLGNTVSSRMGPGLSAQRGSKPPPPLPPRRSDSSKPPKVPPRDGSEPRLPKAATIPSPEEV